MGTFKISILLLLFTTVALKARAHDYQSVYAYRIALFDNNYNRINGLRVDSAKVVAADTILYPFATIQEVSAQGCFSPYKASWIGEKVVIKPGGNNLFFNRDGDTITLKTQARLYEPWIAFRRGTAFRVEASVQALELGNVLGFSDSVKTIAFRVIDQQGNTVDHTLNKLSVKISKTYGFVEALNFNLFPDIRVSNNMDMLNSYTLVGLTNPLAGIQNLRWFEVNGFSPGDELHIQEHNFGDDLFYQPIREYDNRCIYKYLERIDYADSIVYRYARKQSIKSIYTASTTLKTFNDTVRSVVGSNPDFDKLPGEPIVNGGSAMQMYMRNDELLMKIKPSAMNERYSGSGNCWSAIAGEGCLPEMRYIDGLGGPYYYCSGYIGDRMERKLVYYKKGDTEWGERLVITNSQNLETDQEVKVYPNPASDVVTFQVSDASPIHELWIYSQTGELVKTAQFRCSSFKISLSGLNSGIYLYQITSSYSVKYRSKLIVK